MEISRICKHCKFWGLDNATKDLDSAKGFCRRYAPKNWIYKYNGELYRWPYTLSKDWCGEFVMCTLKFAPVSEDGR